LHPETTSRIPIRRVSAPGEAWLELRGSILVYHKQTWVSASSMYIPVEWVQIAEGHGRDLRRLWAGLMGCLVAILLSLPLSLLIFRMGISGLADAALAAALGALWVFALATGLISLAAFLRLRPTITFAVQGEFYTFDIRFWRPEHGGEPLQELLDRLRQVRDRVCATAPYPVRMNHIWHRSRPYRRALVMGTAVSMLFYLGMMAPALLQAAGYDMAFSNAYFALLAAPPLGSVAWLALRRNLPWGMPRLYREGVTACERGELDRAVQSLESLLTERPDLDPARALLVRVLTEQGAFDAALGHCEHLARRHPGTASGLQANIWAIRRIHDRMHET
jgi:tetratricopeptide (TPR) repeat protein